ncbi:MAG: cation diffusion facilitator family transporter [Ktedonobacterales bacterium]
MRLTSPRSYAWLSVAAALVTLGLTFTAYLLTGSVGLLSAAAELLVNLVAALVAVWALWLASRPADDVHTYGHTKAEYFSSGVEGALIVLAAAAIIWTAIQHLLHPHPLEQVGIGLVVGVLAAAINGAVALVLLRAGKRLRSITLEADGQHLLTDVWTMAGVLVGVALVGITGWYVLDPIIALLVALNIIWTGVRLIRASGLGLLDTSLEPEDLRIIANTLAPFRERGIDFHAQRTRQAGTRRFVSMHVLVPGDWTVKRGHDICEEVELAIHKALPDTTVFTHLEPREDPVAFEDQTLDRNTQHDAVDSAAV